MATADITAERIEAILRTLPRLTIGLVGDLFLDRYLEIDARLTEPSIETGLDAYQVVRVRPSPGAAGTVINNLAALGIGCIQAISPALQTAQAGPVTPAPWQVGHSRLAVPWQVGQMT